MLTNIGNILQKEIYLASCLLIADLTARLSWIKWENLGVIGAPAITSFAPVQR